MQARIELDDFFTGLFAGLAHQGVKIVSQRNSYFYRAVESSFNKLLHDAEINGIDTGFYIYLHPIYKDSSLIDDGLSNAIQRDIIGLDNPEYQTIRLKISKSDAENILNDLPGGKELFLTTAKEFRNVYNDMTA